MSQGDLARTSVADDSQAFNFHDGTKVHSLNELLDKLRVLDNPSFDKFVSEEQHDFALWIKFALNNADLAKIVENTTAKELLITVLDSYLKNQQSPTPAESAPASSDPSPFDSAPAQPTATTETVEQALAIDHPEQTAQPNISVPEPAPAAQPEPTAPVIDPAPPTPQPAAPAAPAPVAPAEPEPAPTPAIEPTPAPTPVPAVQPEPTPAPAVDPDPMPEPAPPSAPSPPEPAQEPASANLSIDISPSVSTNDTLAEPSGTISDDSTQGIDTSSISTEITPEPQEPEPTPKEVEENEQKSAKAIDAQEIIAEFKGTLANYAHPQRIILKESEVKLFAERIALAKKEIGKVFIGQDNTVSKVILCLMSDAHTLLEGVPGLAKSLLVEVLTGVISDTTFNRIQFLPDMLPADVIGGQIYNPKTSTFITVKGPIFANFVLADEINRAPPKTHAALMEAMAEKKINIDKDEFILDRPFLVLATQNPLENKGTYALPEAVLDRFMFKVDLPYPERKHEKVIITENATTKSSIKAQIKPVLSKDDFMDLQRKVKEVYISERIKEYILDIIHATRGSNKKIEGLQFIQYGGGPRASIYLGIAAKAQAITRGRNYVLPDDVAFVAKDILRHRVSLNFKGKAHNISSDKIVEEILLKVNAL